uniref:Protein S100-A1 n=1 Tax=Zosterops lateralis melanops TaxID=1220523 RepID=A0A8D2PPL0_ZOSLA
RTAATLSPQRNLFYSLNIPQSAAPPSLLARLVLPDGSGQFPDQPPELPEPQLLVVVHVQLAHLLLQGGHVLRGEARTGPDPGTGRGEQGTPPESRSRGSGAPPELGGTSGRCSPRSPSSASAMGSQLEGAMETLINVFHHYSGKEGDKYKLSKKELKELLQSELGCFLETQKDSGAVEKIMQDLDENGDGEVDFQEFVVLVAALTVACNTFFWENA